MKSDEHRVDPKTDSVPDIKFHELAIEAAKEHGAMLAEPPIERTTVSTTGKVYILLRGFVANVYHELEFTLDGTFVRLITLSRRPGYSPITVNINPNEGGHHG